MAGTVNVADQGTFSLTAGVLAGGDPETLKDGDTREGSAWDDGTVRWTSEGVEIEILFPEMLTFVGSRIWGDYNDVYRLEAWSGGNWQQMFVVPWMPAPAEGVQPRTAGYVENMPFQASFQSWTTDRLRISRQNDPDDSDDAQYSLSEIELYVDSSVPEPSTFALLGAGLGALAVRRLRRS